MSNILSWNNVTCIKGRIVEFVACHEFMAWRRHGHGESQGGRFHDLKNAITSSGNGARSLLQSQNGNANHKNYQIRGPASHVAVWYADQPWAILMNKEEVTLVLASQVVEAGQASPQSSIAVRTRLDQLFKASPVELRRVLDKNFYRDTIASKG